MKKYCWITTWLQNREQSLLTNSQTIRYFRVWLAVLFVTILANKCFRLSSYHLRRLSKSFRNIKLPEQRLSIVPKWIVLIFGKMTNQHETLQLLLVIRAKSLTDGLKYFNQLQYLGLIANQTKEMLVWLFFIWIEVPVPNTSMRYNLCIHSYWDGRLRTSAHFPSFILGHQPLT